MNRLLLLLPLFACAGAGKSKSSFSEAELDCIDKQFMMKPDAERVCTASCNAGHARACTTLGSMFDRGHLVAADPARARSHYDRGCDGGDGQGCFDAARSRRDGGDAAGAVPYFARACDKKILAENHALACFTAGDAYYTGTGVPKDPARAEPLLRAACKSGNIAACDRFDFKPK